MCNVRINHRIHSGGEERMALQEYKEPNVFKRYWKQIIVGILVVAVIVGGGFALWKFAFSQSSYVKISNAVCLPEETYNQLNGIKVETGDDGKTIEKITVTEGFTKEGLEVLAENNGYSTDDLEVLYNQMALQLSVHVGTFLNGNEHLSWFGVEVTPDKEHLSARITYTFDLTNPGFVAEDENTLAFMKQFNVDSLYNEETKTYEWSHEAQEKLEEATQYICESE